MTGLTDYDPAAYPSVAVTVDLALMTIRDGRLAVLLVKRGAEPFRGRWALPGGFVGPTEDIDSGALRELAEETGLDVEPWHVEQLRTYGAVDRDPRMRVVSVAYLAFLPIGAEPTAGSDAAAARWWAADEVWARGGPKLAFDHDKILRDAIERCRAKLEYTTLAATFLDEPFTLGDLRRVYEAVWGVPLHHSNLARKITAAAGYVVPVKGTRGRAKLYVRGKESMLTPPIIRPQVPSGS